MKKYLILLSSICILLAFLVGAIFMYQKKPHSEIGILVVNGKLLENEKIELHNTYAIVPFVDVLLELGFSIEWADHDCAIVSIENKLYHLNVAEASFVEDGSTFNLLQPPPGVRSYYCKSTKGDVLLDTITLRSALYIAGVNVVITVDGTSGAVYINT